MINDKIILELRKKSGYTQKEFGKLLGVSNRAVSKWENGISSPSFDTAIKISKAFNISLEELFIENYEENKIIKKEITGMPSVKGIYKTGRGPSSSHTMGPCNASNIFKKRNSNATSFKVILYGSLAHTGKGHLTDKAIKDALYPYKTEIIFDYKKTDIPHPNTMVFYAYKGEEIIDEMEVYSVGGGQIEIKGEKLEENKNIYNLTTFYDIGRYLKKNKMRLWEYVLEVEGKEIFDFLSEVWNTMEQSIERGLSTEGVLPGGLNVLRKAKSLYGQTHIDETRETRENRLVCSYAFAVSEENAGGGTIVTAPTCGSCGVLPAVLYYEKEKRGFLKEDILKALATASLIGNLIKTNASISGAECGCQAEIGSACSMAAAALGELLYMNIDEIEYASEIAIEHHLGLTCDPVFGLVQIPCIERNAVAAMRAINAVNLANFLTDSRKISFDMVVKTMYETGKDLSKKYRETMGGGLAKLYK